MKDKRKITVLIIICLIFATLMIVGWVMYDKAKKDNASDVTKKDNASDVTKKDNASDVTGLLVIMYQNGASSCKEFTTKGASSLLVVPFDTCVPSGEDQYLKLIESNGKYIVSQYKDPECTEIAANGIITFDIDEIGKCVDIPPSSNKTMAIAYELYGPIKPYLFNVINVDDANSQQELINQYDTNLENCEDTIEEIQEFFCKDESTDSIGCKNVLNIINSTGNTVHQSSL